MGSADFPEHVLFVCVALTHAESAKLTEGAVPVSAIQHSMVVGGGECLKAVVVMMANMVALANRTNGVGCFAPHRPLGQACFMFRGAMLVENEGFHIFEKETPRPDRVTLLGRIKLLELN